MKTCPYHTASGGKLDKLTNNFYFLLLLTTVVQQPLLNSNHPKDGLSGPCCPPPIATELITNHSLYSRRPQWLSKREQELKYTRSPTFTVCGVPVDGGIAAPAFTFRFSIPVFTLGVFSTNEPLCTEVITCGERDKGSLDVVWLETFAHWKQEAWTWQRDQR